MLLFIAVITLQAVRGVRLGASVSVIGAEFRALLGFAAALIAMPILEDRRSCRRLLGALLALGLLLGVSGILQWTFDLGFGEAGGFGVRQGVALTTTGIGQLQGGLFAYPVAVLLSLAALSSRHIRSGPVRWLTVAVLVLNCADLLLTFERTLWIATLAGAAVLLARAGTRARRSAVRWVPGGIAVLLVAVALSPGTFTTAVQRFESVGDYASDNSVRYRLVESEHVLARVYAHPLTGSGLGATVYWGRPWEGRSHGTQLLARRLSVAELEAGHTRRSHPDCLDCDICVVVWTLDAEPLAAAVARLPGGARRNADNQRDVPDRQFA